MLPPSARPEGQLTLSRWPGSFCPPPHSPVVSNYGESLQVLPRFYLHSGWPFCRCSAKEATHYPRNWDKMNGSHLCLCSVRCVFLNVRKIIPSIKQHVERWHFFFTHSDLRFKRKRNEKKNLKLNKLYRFHLCRGSSERAMNVTCIAFGNWIIVERLTWIH